MKKTEKYNEDGDFVCTFSPFCFPFLEFMERVLYWTGDFAKFEKKERKMKKLTVQKKTWKTTRKSKIDMQILLVRTTGRRTNAHASLRRRWKGKRGNRRLSGRRVLVIFPQFFQETFLLKLDQIVCLKSEGKMLSEFHSVFFTFTDYPESNSKYCQNLKCEEIREKLGWS